VLEQLIEIFYANKAILLLKINNYLNGNKNIFMLKLIIESLIFKGLKAKNPVVEYSLLLSLTQS
jgi:hypothetical protein